MASRKGIVALLAVALVVATAGTALAAKEIRIGVSAPITGDIAALGQSTKNAALMAEEEINAKGGLKVGKEKIKVKFVIEDDENKPESTATVFQKLINQDQVLAIIGSQSSKCSNAGAPIAEAAGVPQISPWSTNPNVTKGKQFVFRACFIDPFQGKVVAMFAKNRLKAKTAAVLYDVASDYNKGIAEVFKEEFARAGGKVVAFETYTTGDKDFSAQLTKIKTANPDVLFLPNYFNEVPLQVQQAHKLGLKAKVIGSDSWDSPDLLKLGAEYLEGTYFSNHYSPDVKNPISDKFVAAYEKKFGMKPDAAGALTYDAAYIVFQAIEKAGKLDRKAIRDALAQTKGFKGVTGTITFAGSPDPVKSAVMIKITGGKFVYDSTVNP
ncbi:MAG: ABC transporter substrate-binding protein [Bacillota bacterium]|nr:ABC transporter substrate-binding protein [Bacillota bacterium]